MSDSGKSQENIVQPQDLLSHSQGFVNQSQEDSSKYPKRARKAPEKFEPKVLMNFQKTENSRSKLKDKVRKQDKRTQQRMDDMSSSGDIKNDDDENNNKK